MSVTIAMAPKKIKTVKCNICKREMETIVEENPPFYCWRCGDKHELGGFHEIK